MGQEVGRRSDFGEGARGVVEVSVGATTPTPKRRSTAGDAISRRLDTITLEDHMMERHGISRETVRTFLSPDEGGGYGLGPDALSGYTAYAADMLHPLDISDETGTQMFPDGNGGIARLIAKTLIPESIAGDQLARKTYAGTR